MDNFPSTGLSIVDYHGLSKLISTYLGAAKSSSLNMPKFRTDWEYYSSNDFDKIRAEFKTGVGLLEDSCDKLEASGKIPNPSEIVLEFEDLRYIIAEEDLGMSKHAIMWMKDHPRIAYQILEGRRTRELEASRSVYEILYKDDPAWPYIEKALEATINPDKAECQYKASFFREKRKYPYDVEDNPIIGHELCVEGKKFTFELEPLSIKVEEAIKGEIATYYEYIDIGPNDLEKVIIALLINADKTVSHKIIEAIPQLEKMYMKKKEG